MLSTTNLINFKRWRSLLLIVNIFLLAPFIANGQAISPENLQTDAKILWQVLNELHPGLYRQNDTIDLEKAYQSLLDDCQTAKTSEETFLLFSKFSAAVKCGHTYVNPFNQPKSSIIKKVLQTKALLPFYFRIIDEKLVVTASATPQIPPMAVIKSINNQPIKKILDALIPFIKADGNRRAKRLKDLELAGYSDYEYFDYYFALVFGLTNKVDIELIDNREVKVDLMTLKERQAQLPTKIDYDSQWDFKIVDNLYGHLTIGNFVTWKLNLDWKAFIDDAFQQLANKNIKNLVIDIRTNEGGNEVVPDYITHKIAKKAGKKVNRIQHLRYKKVSDELRPYLNTWSRWFWNIGIWTKKLDDTYRTPYRFLASKKKIKRNKKAFQGKVFLLTSPVNSSATFHFSETMKQNQYATLIGTETGGSQKGISAGQLFFLKLPNTQIEIDIPLIGFYPKQPLKDEGILPDIFVTESAEDVVSGRDKYIEAVVKKISQ